MKIIRIILPLLLSMAMMTTYADKPKKQDPLLKGPFFMRPYFNAFGMRVYEVDTTVASQGCVDVYEHQKARAYYFVTKKNAETSMEYNTGKEGFLIDNIVYHVYREYPTVEETTGFMWNEIPQDWQEISEQEYIEHTKEKCRRMVGIESPIYRSDVKCYRLSQIADRPTIYAGVCVSAFPAKKKVAVSASIYYWEDGGARKK
uniref:Uncharacterized protein n=1 Tax=Prevotella sp. GTC17260 TaxID=3236796 RepID=A0AB33JBP2_9BACT